jgi:hypothetical protein
MIRFCRLLNANPAHFGLHPSAFQGCLITFAYQTLQICPLDEPPDTDLNQAFSLALLSLLTTILFESAMANTRRYEVLASRARQAISGLMSAIQLKEQPVLLWILFACGISTCDAGDETWLYPCIRSCASALSLTSWDDARATIGQLPWVHVVHDGLGSRVWSAAMIDHDG